MPKKKVIELKSLSTKDGPASGESKANRCVNLREVADALQAEKDRDMEERLAVLDSENSDLTFKVEQYQASAAKSKLAAEERENVQSEKIAKLEEQLAAATEAMSAASLSSTNSKTQQPDMGSQTPGNDVLREELIAENERLTAEVAALRDTLDKMNKSFTEVCEAMDSLEQEKASLETTLARQETDAVEAARQMKKEIADEHHRRLRAENKVAVLQEQMAVLQANYEQQLVERVKLKQQNDCFLDRLILKTCEYNALIVKCEIENKSLKKRRNIEYLEERLETV